MSAEQCKAALCFAQLSATSTECGSLVEKGLIDDSDQLRKLIHTADTALKDLTEIAVLGGSRGSPTTPPS